MQISELLKKNTDLSALDCELLLAHALGVSREHLIAHDRDEVAENVLQLFESYISRIRDGEPVAYITGEKEFYGLNFFVDKRVLVPRPETELLVEKTLGFLNDVSVQCAGKVLDVGMGSGNIAVSIAKNNEDVEVLALDFDEGACEVARLNAQQHGVDDRVNIFQSDLLEVLDEDEEFDVIVTNLPYIGEVKHRYVSESAEKYEPKLALFGGDNGLELYKKMFQQLKEKNIGFGLLIGEFGFGQSPDMADLLTQFFDQSWCLEKDLAGIERIFCVNGNLLK